MGTGSLIVGTKAFNNSVRVVVPPEEVGHKVPRSRPTRQWEHAPKWHSEREVRKKIKADMGGVVRHEHLAGGEPLVHIVSE